MGDLVLTYPVFSCIKKMTADRRRFALIEAIELTKSVRCHLGATRREKLLPLRPVEPCDLFVGIGLQGRCLEEPIKFILSRLSRAELIEGCQSDPSVGRLKTPLSEPQAKAYQ